MTTKVCSSVDHPGPTRARCNPAQCTTLLCITASSDYLYIRSRIDRQVHTSCIASALFRFSRMSGIGRVLSHLNGPREKSTRPTWCASPAERTSADAVRNEVKLLLERRVTFSPRPRSAPGATRTCSSPSPGSRWRSGTRSDIDIMLLLWRWSLFQTLPLFQSGYSSQLKMILDVM